MDKIYLPSSKKNGAESFIFLLLLLNYIFSTKYFSIKLIRYNLTKNVLQTMPISPNKILQLWVTVKYTLILRYIRMISWVV